jgi:hypothetical protein
MRDIYQVLREKETEMVRLRNEVDVLRAVIPLLTDDEDDLLSEHPLYTPLQAANSD